MSDDRQSAPETDDTVPSEAAPHDPGIAPESSVSSTDGEPAAGAPSDKAADPERQPT